MTVTTTIIPAQPGETAIELSFKDGEVHRRDRQIIAWQIQRHRDDRGKDEYTTVRAVGVSGSFEDDDEDPVMYMYFYKESDGLITPIGGNCSFTLQDIDAASEYFKATAKAFAPKPAALDPPPWIASSAKPSIPEPFVGHAMAARP